MKKNQQTKNKKGLEARPEQLNTTADRPQIDLALRRENRALETEELLEILRKDFPRLYELAEIIGKWIWVTFPDKQPVEITSQLSQLGFHWNTLRQAWQHPCGTLQEKPKTFDPRKRYSTRFAADKQAA